MKRTDKQRLDTLEPLDGRRRTTKQLKTILAGGPDPLGDTNEQESKA